MSPILFSILIFLITEIEQLSPQIMKSVVYISKLVDFIVVYRDIEDPFQVIGKNAPINLVKMKILDKRCAQTDIFLVHTCLSQNPVQVSSNCFFFQYLCFHTLICLLSEALHRT